MSRRIAIVALFGLLMSLVAGALGDEAGEEPMHSSPYAAWKNGPTHEADFFPIAVWLQSPKNARRYRDAGINTYVGLWEGPTEAQLAELREAGMGVVCHQNAVGLAHLDDPIIVGWMHGDEPDNAQPLASGRGYGPPVPPTKIIRDYQEIRRADPSRPVFLNLGQGVAWDDWHGRGVRTNHPEDYPEYVKGCDIVSFDIYPVVHADRTVSGNLWYVARGVQRLTKWTEGERIVWNCIECTRIASPTGKPTPHEVRCEVWMSIIHGSMGLIYFVHEWTPKFNESALLSDPNMLTEITAINKRIADLAPVLNSPTIAGGATALPDDTRVPVAVMMKRHQSVTYVFAVAMRDDETSATLTVHGIEGQRTVEVLDEDRTLTSHDGVFRDAFGPYDVHLYRIGNTSVD